MSKRESILSKPSRRQEVLHVPEWDCDIVVRELDTKARTDFLKGLEFLGGNMGSVNLTPLLPFVTDLILDPDTNQPLFELADHDTLVSDHPGVVSRVVFRALDLSDIGADADGVAEGN